MSTKNSVLNQRHDSVVAALDSGVIGTIFSMFTNEAFQRVLEGLGHFILFPLAGIFALYRTILAIRQAQLDKNKGGTLFKAVVEVVSTAAILTAVIGGLVAAATFALAAPVIFTAVLGAKTLYHLGAALYYLGKSNVSGIETEKKSRYRANMGGHLKGALVLGLSTVAVGLVMLAAHTVFAWLGVAAAVIGIGISVWNAVQSHQKIKQVEQVIAPAEAAASEATLVYSNILTASPDMKPVPVPVRDFSQKSSVTRWGKLFEHRPKNDALIATPVVVPPSLVL